MATIEMNMLSVITCGSISVRVFCPDMDKLALDDKNHTTKYPVLWLLHDDGGAALDFLGTPAERIAKQYGIFLIAPDQHHAMCTDMKFGPRYEYFMSKEFPEICRNCLPISYDPAKNWIAGVGTGAYGAVKMALKHPEIFSRAIALHGKVDIEAMIAKALAGKDTGTPQNQASLEAVFGSLDTFHGSADDLFALEKPEGSRFFFAWDEKAPEAEENARLAIALDAETLLVDKDDDFDSCQVSLRRAAQWLMK